MCKLIKGMWCKSLGSFFFHHLDRIFLRFYFYSFNFLVCTHHVIFFCFYFSVEYCGSTIPKVQDCWASSTPLLKTYIQDTLFIGTNLIFSDWLALRRVTRQNLRKNISPNNSQSHIHEPIHIYTHTTYTYVLIIKEKQILI